MGTAGQVDGLPGALLRCVNEPDRIALIQQRLDRYCHRLRNRLNSLKLSLYLARKLSPEVLGPDWNRTEDSCRSIETLVEQLQGFCAPIHVTPTEGDLNQWIEQSLPDWRRELGQRHIQLEAEGPDESLPGRADWTRLGRGLDGLIAAWAEFGTPEATIRLTWGRDLDRFLVQFDGDGWITRPQGSVDSLALPILARVLSAHNGALIIDESAPSIGLNWPTG